MINCVNVVHPLVIFIRTSKEQIHNSFVLCHHWWIRVKLNVWGGSLDWVSGFAILQIVCYMKLW